MSGPHVATRAEINRLIQVTAQLGPWAMPVVEAIRDGHIAVTFLCRGDRAPLADMRRTPKPMLLWIGDDDEQSTGPDGWRAALPATRWARAALIHAAGGETAHYAAAVAGAILTGRLLLVETSITHAPAWAKLLPGKSALCIMPKTGQHPIDMRETRH